MGQIAQSPAPEEQIQFLSNVHGLLAQGLFTATYKYALVVALADLSVELGDDSGRPLPLSTFVIADKFVECYWRHAIPYASAKSEGVLRQNTGQPAKIISLIEHTRKTHGDSLTTLMCTRNPWGQLVRKVEVVVKVMRCGSCKQSARRSWIFCIERAKRTAVPN